MQTAIVWPDKTLDTSLSYLEYECIQFQYIIELITFSRLISLTTAPSTPSLTPAPTPNSEEIDSQGRVQSEKVKIWLALYTKQYLDKVENTTKNSI